MFKALRITQVMFVALIATGCSATNTSRLAANHQTTNSEGSETLQLPAATPKPAPIAVGASKNTREGFVDTTGKLSPDLLAYAYDVSTTRQIPLHYVDALLRDAQYNATVARLVTPHHRHIRRSWVTYRKRFVEPIRIKTGVRFWTEEKSTLDRIATQYGVPQSVIVAILGVETIYGRNTGSFRTLDALATLGFRNPDTERPKRSAMFRNQLADLIQLDYQNKLDALTTTGSYAGAVGLPQFMPESLIRFAVDGNNDGIINVRTSSADAIASVANYLRHHGWVPGLPVFAPVALPENAKQLVDGGLKPTLTWQQLQAKGATVRKGSRTEPESWKNYLLGVVDLQDEPRNTDEYRTATPNFFAITQYNHSYFYAASVADLAKAIADQMGYGWLG